MSKKSKKIALTGGGTAGHVMPCIALFPVIREEGYDAFYVGSHKGMEKELTEHAGIRYYGISTGKLRRYFDPENLKDPFRVLKGFFDARRILAAERPDVLFSKGGFVSVPVVWAAASLKIPVIIHESDMTPGLANTLSIPMARYVCCNFPETKDSIPGGKAVMTGSPLREALLKGDGSRGRALCGFSDPEKPVILVEGGSLGALAVNLAVRQALPELLKEFYVAHICGREKTDDSLNGTPGYVQFEYVDEQMGDMLAMADVIISRAGANSICEFLALKKPALLIPLPAKSSRGDQIKNAASFEAMGYSMTLDEDEMSAPVLTAKVRELYQNRQRYIDNMAGSRHMDSVDIIMDLIRKCADEKIQA